MAPEGLGSRSRRNTPVQGMRWTSRSGIGRSARAVGARRARSILRSCVSNREACKIVGVNVRTGERWRNGRIPSGRAAGAPPITSAAPSVVRGRFLNEDERVVIADRRRTGATIRRIATELGRDPATVSRELRCNAHQPSGGSRPYAARRRADVRRPRPKVRILAADAELPRVVQDHLARKRSPAVPPRTGALLCMPARDIPYSASRAEKRSTRCPGPSSRLLIYCRRIPPESRSRLMR